MPIPCPACEFGLRGHRNEGYRCVRCHARFTPRFVHRIIRDAGRERLREAFSEEPESMVLTDEPTSVAEAMREVRMSLDETLETYEDDEEDVPSHAFPDDTFVKKRSGY